MDYITKSELEQYTGLQIDASLNTFLDTISAAAKEYIDLYCSTEDVGYRWFDDDAEEDSTRYFNGNGLSRLYVDDLREVTTIVASITRGNGVTLVENTDFFCYPLNHEADGLPIEYIELANPAFNLPANSRMTAGGQSAYVFYEGQRNIAITGRWGYNEVDDDNFPPAIKTAALKICTGIIKENIGDTDLKELTSETLGEYSASYAKVKDIADRLGINDLLDPFVRAKKTGAAGTRLIS